MKDYTLYYVDGENRLECMLVCSLNHGIDWCENGLRIVSWRYNAVAKGRAETLDDVFRHYSVLRIDRRRNRQMRTVSIGDIIVFDGEPWIVSAFGFAKVPEILAKRIL